VKAKIERKIPPAFKRKKSTRKRLSSRVPSDSRRLDFITLDRLTCKKAGQARSGEGASKWEYR